ncbi:MAG: ribosomal-processing cysteine protease Prp [Clostridiaceae bacterium]|nr:ribosomal-processing cysteine protease Prp [Clostridiaceae bacterium]
MIKAVIFHDALGRIKGFKVKGHAGYSEAGKDIVCSAVTAIVFTTLGSLEEQVGFKDYKESDGFIECKVPESLGESESYIADIILRTLEIGLRQIELDYSEYIQVYYEEV